MQKNKILVSVNLVTFNEENRIRRALNSVLSQDYPFLEINVIDNASSDKTKDIVKSEFCNKVNLYELDKNYCFGGGQNRGVKFSSGKYIIGMSADVVLERNFISEAVKIMERDENIGALQAKIRFLTKDGKKTDIIDTTGFEIFKSRRLINRGHGEKDLGQFDREGEIFSYEGAVPIWRRKALLDVAIFNEIHDEDFWWMSDDIDLGWRMRLFGWKSYYSPKVLAYHERGTTKKLASSYFDFIKIRRNISSKKRMLDILNYRLCLIKNDFCITFLKHLPFFIKRELMLIIYFILFEQRSLLAYPLILLNLPKMIKKRKEIKKRIKVRREDIEIWFK